jgi:hypothetical protein
MDQGETIKKVASDLGVGEVTVGDCRRKRAEIEEWCSLRAPVCISEKFEYKNIVTVCSNPVCLIFNLMFNNLPNLLFYLSF